MTARPPRSPAAKEAEFASDALDNALLSLGALPSAAADTRIRERMQQAQRALATVVEQDADLERHLDHLERARRSLDQLIDALRGPESGHPGQQLARRLEPLRDALVAARAPTVDLLAPLSAAPLAVVAEPDAFAPCVGVPHVYRSTELPVALAPVPAAELDFTPPTIDVEALFAELRAGDDVDLEAHLGLTKTPTATPERLITLTSERLITLRPVPPTDDIDQRGVRGENAQLRRMARDCLEGIGADGNMRALANDDLWDESIVGFEDRLLAKLDALMALGIACHEQGGTLRPLDEALRYCRGGPTTDLYRAFAGALVLTCVDADAAARAAIIEMRATAPSAAPAYAAAFALASGDTIDAALRRGCREEHDPQRLAAMVLALRRRQLRGGGGDAVPELLLLLQHPDDSVRAEAVRSLAAVRDENLVRTLLQDVVNDPDDSVACAALNVQLRVDRTEALERLRDDLNDEAASPGELERNTRARLLTMLALGGSGDDAELLRQCVNDDPRSVEALGWHGDPAHGLTLLNLLNGPQKVSAAALVAIRRITGASPEDIAELRAHKADMRQPWWAAQTEDWPAQRHRLGKPYSLQSVIDELAQTGVRHRERVLLSRELHIAGAPLHIDVNDWCARQHTTLRALQHATVTRGDEDVPFVESITPGEWLTETVQDDPH